MIANHHGIITGVAGGIFVNVLSHRPPLVLGRRVFMQRRLLGALLLVLLEKNTRHMSFNSI